MGLFSDDNEFEMDNKNIVLKKWQAISDQIDSFNSNLQHAMNDRYHALIQMMIMVAQFLMDISIFITIEGPVLAIYGITLIPVVLIEKLSIALFWEGSYAQEVHFSDVFRAIQNKFNRLQRTSEAIDAEDTLQPHIQKSIDMMVPNIFELTLSAFSAQLGDDAWDNTRIIAGQILLGIYTAITFPIALILMLSNQFIIEKLSDYGVSLVTQGLIRTLFNVTSALPLILYDCGQLAFEKCCSWFQCQSDDDSDAPLVMSDFNPSYHTTARGLESGATMVDRFRDESSDEPSCFEWLTSPCSGGACATEEQPHCTPTIR